MVFTQLSYSNRPFHRLSHVITFDFQFTSHVPFPIDNTWYLLSKTVLSLLTCFAYGYCVQNIVAVFIFLGQDVVRLAWHIKLSDTGSLFHLVVRASRVVTDGDLIVCVCFRRTHTDLQIPSNQEPDRSKHLTLADYSCPLLHGIVPTVQIVPNLQEHNKPVGSVYFSPQKCNDEVYRIETPLKNLEIALVAYCICKPLHLCMEATF